MSLTGSLPALTRIPLALLTAGLLSLTSSAFGQGIITTIAGGDKVFPNRALQANATAIQPWGTPAVAPNGDVYFIDFAANSVLRASPDGRLTLVAGNGLNGFSGDGGPATQASLSFPYGVALDSRGNLYIADLLNGRVRRVDTNGVITTVAGNGSLTFSGDRGPATNAGMAPTDVLFDASGNMIISDYFNFRIRQVNASGIITTIAGTGTNGSSGDGGLALRAALRPYRIALDRTGNLYFVDRDYTGNDVTGVRKIDTSGQISLIAGNGTTRLGGDNVDAKSVGLALPEGIAVDSNGNVIVIEFNRLRQITQRGSSSIITTIGGSDRFGFEGDGGTVGNARFNYPQGLALDASGNIYITDYSNNRVRRVGRDLIVSSIAGNGGATFTSDGTAAVGSPLANPEGVAVDAGGTVYIADSQNHRVRRINSDGTLTTVAGTGSFGNTDSGAEARALAYPNALAFDPQGNLVIAEYSGARVRRLNGDGSLTTLAGNGKPMSIEDGANGDGGPARQSKLGYVGGIAIDKQGNLYISEVNWNRIRKITPDGVINNFVNAGNTPGYNGDNIAARTAQLFQPRGLAVDSAGNLYVADSLNNRVRKISTSGVITTVAGTGRNGDTGDGGLATAATVDAPTQVAVDNTGAIFITTGSNHIRRVGTDGRISTVAGNGSAIYSGDGGRATAAGISTSGITVDNNGNLYIADLLNNRVRLVYNAAAPSFTLSTNQLTFTGGANSGPTASQSVTVAGVLNGVPQPGLQFTATVSNDSAAWLKVTPDRGATPQSVQVTADLTNLGPGTYNGTVTVSVSGANPSTRTIAVTATVTTAAPAQLTLSTRSLSFSYQPGTDAPVGTLNLLNTGGGSLNYQATATTDSGGNWLLVSGGSGTAVAGQPSTLQVTINPQGLQAGQTYRGTITVRAGNSTETALVLLSVLRPQAITLLSNTGLTFRVSASGGLPLPQRVGVLNIGQGSMDYQLRTSALAGGNGWLKVNTNSGRVNTPYTDVSYFEVQADPRGLAAGDYYGRVQVVSAASNSPQTISVLLTVLPSDQDPGPEVRPTGLVFTGTAAQNPSSQEVRLASRNARNISYNSGRLTLSGAQWFQHLPTADTLQPDQAGVIRVQPNFKDLAPGVQRGVVTILFDNGAPSQTVEILSVVAPEGTNLNAKGPERQAAGCSNSVLQVLFTQPASNFQVTAAQPEAVSMKIVDGCGRPHTGRGATVKLLSTLSSTELPINDLGDGTWTASWLPQGSPAPVALRAFAVFGQGATTQTGNASLSGNMRAATANTSVTLRDNAPPVTHAASQQPAQVAPGGIISIYGSSLADNAANATQAPLPVEFQNAEVKLGDRSLPILYAGPSQINAQVPYDLPTNPNFQLEVRRGTALSLPIPVAVADAQPGVFTENQQGFGQGIIFGPDQRTLAKPGSPVRANEVIVIWATGLGAVNPTVGTGELAPSSPLSVVANPVTITVGGRSAVVDFAGLAPGLAGVYQINARVPAGVTPGNEVPVVVTVAGKASPPVTIAVQ